MENCKVLRTEMTKQVLDSFFTHYYTNLHSQKVSLFPRKCLSWEGEADHPNKSPPQLQKHPTTVWLKTAILVFNM